MIEICFASNNHHKLQEIRNILGKDFSIVSLHDIGCFQDLPETRDTFEGNALQKAEYVLENFKIPCFADDSGLEVDALQGAPGVYSARYAGPQRDDQDNIDLLLENLRHQTTRQARFKTVIALVTTAEKKTFEGTIEGKIIEQRRGINGFGYDPVFVPDGLHQTFAEMSKEQKNQISHRAVAVRKLAAFLKDTYAN